MSASTEERVDTTADPLEDSDIVHYTCCRQYGEKAICGVSLEGQPIAVDKDADCVVCLDLTDMEVATMIAQRRDHAHCPLDHRCCPPRRRERT